MLTVQSIDLVTCWSEKELRRNKLIFYVIAANDQMGHLVSDYPHAWTSGYLTIVAIKYEMNWIWLLKNEQRLEKKSVMYFISIKHFFTFFIYWLKSRNARAILSAGCHVTLYKQKYITPVCLRTLAPIGIHFHKFSLILC